MVLKMTIEPGNGPSSNKIDAIKFKLLVQD